MSHPHLHHRSRVRWVALLAVVAALFVFASVASAQPGVKKANRLTFDINQNPEGNISQDARTMTTQLPAHSTITSSYRGRHVFMTLAYSSSSSKRPQARFVQASSGHHRVTCNLSSSTSPAPNGFSCSADATWIRGLTSETRIKIEVGGAGVDGKLAATWIIQPQPPITRKRLPR